jgi:hypothetical protein
MDLKQVARFNWFPLEVWISIWLFSYTQGKNIVHAWDIIYPSKIGDLGDFRPSEHGFWFQKLGPVIRNLRSHIPISLAVECVKVFFQSTTYWKKCYGFRHGYRHHGPQVVELPNWEWRCQSSIRKKTHGPMNKKSLRILFRSETQNQKIVCHCAHKKHAPRFMG